MLSKANVRKLNNDFQTPLYFASKDRIREWGGGGSEISQVVFFNKHIAENNFKTSKTE